VTSAYQRMKDLLVSAEMARAYTMAVLLAVFASQFVVRISGIVTFTAIITVLCGFGVAILVVRREELSLLRLAPTTLIAFLVWTLVSVLWSTEPAYTLRAWASLLAFALLAITIGHIRDTLQTVRAIGDVLRGLLALSLALEIFSGILIDTPLPLLGIEGNLAAGGPVQGIFGSRNMLGFIAVIALITFVIEWRSRSVTRAVAVPSIALATLLALFSASPTVAVLLTAVTLATAVLALVRHTPENNRSNVQWALGVIVVVGLAIAFVLRHSIIALLDAGSDFSIRADLWNALLDYWDNRPVHGWGWFGPWPRGEYPFNAINFVTDDQHRTALNAYFDTLLQVGALGFALFSAFAGVALVRSWLIASVRRSVVYAWTPLVLVALAVESIFESFTLVGAGWFVLVLCALRAGQSRSWRENIDAAQTGVIPTLKPGAAG